ncbi:MAG: molybdopterin synthase sulfur carrier subunit, partial [Alphaproteobacteria bacterium]
MTKLLYFARMRQIIGKGEEDLAIPGDVKTISMLID